MNEALGSPSHQALIAHVVAHYAGRLSAADLAEAGLAEAGLAEAGLAAAGGASGGAPDQPGRLDAIVRDALYAQKALARGRHWEAVAAVERIRRSLTDLRGHRDGLRLDPAGPARALATMLAEVQADYDLGPRRRALLHQA